MPVRPRAVAYQSLGYGLSSPLSLSLAPASSDTRASLFSTMDVDETLSVPLDAPLRHEDHAGPWSMHVVGDDREWAMYMARSLPSDRPIRTDRCSIRARVDSPCLAITMTKHFPLTAIPAPLEGPAIGMKLRLDGQYLLHASALRLGDVGVAFAAHSGTGKSTLATAMHARGHRVWSDDVLRIEPSTALAYADGRETRLTEASASHLLPTHEALRPPRFTEKSTVRLADPMYASTAHRLDVLFVLTGRTHEASPRFTPVVPAHAAVWLMRMRYPSWMKGPTLDPREFPLSATLAARLPVVLLEVPDDLEQLDATCAAIEAYIAQHHAAAGR